MKRYRPALVARAGRRRRSVRTHPEVTDTGLEALEEERDVYPKFLANVMETQRADAVLPLLVLLNLLKRYADELGKTFL